MSDSTQLKAARELTEVLEQLEATASMLGTLETRKTELLEVLNGTTPPEPQTTPKQVTEPAEPTETIEPAEVVDPRLEVLYAMPNKTEAEKKAKLKAAEELSLEYVDLASTAQKRMIFGILGNQFGIKDDANLKAVIVGIVAEQHHGVKLESVGKELSKQWAKDVIDFLQKAKAEDLKKWEVPF